MGNVMSEAEESEFLEEGFDLDSPDADKQINYGTSAPNCQPKHTQTEDSKPSPTEQDVQQANAQAQQQQNQNHPVEQGMEVAMDDSHMNNLTDPMSPKHRRDSGENATAISEAGSDNSNEHDKKRQHKEQQQAQREKKMSYMQMAKLGYQELVNAIIRPPRADYKVCGS
jgi:type IV secretory pathway VirB10-like protein